jgi:hypothetical protein
MRWIFKIGVTLIILTAITLLQVGVREFLPFPFNHCNVIFVCLVWLLLFTNSTSVLWLAVPVTLLIELFSPLPFGLNSAALIIGLFATSLLLVALFTNHSSSIAFVVSLVGMITYRVVFLLLLFFCLIF